MVDDAFDAIKGDGQIWRQGQGELCFTYKRSVYDSMTFEYFDGIEVDGKHLDEEKDGITNYTCSAGSVNIQLQPEYLKSLSSGEHTLTAILKIDSVTMKADAIFTIVKEESSSDTTYRLPKTGIE